MINSSIFKIAFRILCFLAAAGVLFALIVNLYIVFYADRFILTPEEAAAKHVDCALVLGARVWSSGPSPMLADRLLTGIELYENGATERLLMSGDHGRSEYDEVNAMKRFAVEQDVSAEHVFMDHAGFSTYESAYRAKAVFDVESTIVVTQRYHLYRAVFLARRMGIEAYGVAADRRDYQNALYNNAREAMARVKDFFMILFKPEPTYLGEVIPISGSGALTDDTDEFVN